MGRGLWGFKRGSEKHPSIERGVTVNQGREMGCHGGNVIHQQREGEANQGRVTANQRGVIANEREE